MSDDELLAGVLRRFLDAGNGFRAFGPIDRDFSAVPDDMPEASHALYLDVEVGLTAPEAAAIDRALAAGETPQ